MQVPQARQEGPPRPVTGWREPARKSLNGKGRRHEGSRPEPSRCDDQARRASRWAMARCIWRVGSTWRAKFTRAGSPPLCA